MTAPLIELLSKIASDYKKITGLLFLLIFSFPFLAMGIWKAEQWGYVGHSPEYRLLEDMTYDARQLIKEHQIQTEAVTKAVDYLDRNLVEIRHGADRTVEKLDDLCTIQAMGTTDTDDDKICQGLMDERQAYERQR